MLQRVADAESESDTARFGVGEPPSELMRVNWGALFFGGGWALVYGVWPWFALFIGVRIGGAFFGWYLRTHQLAPPFETPLPISIGLALVEWVPSAVFALRANHAVWQLRSDRLEGRFRPALAKPSTTLSAYLQEQRSWAFLGIGFTGLGFVVTVLDLLSDGSGAGGRTFEFAVIYYVCALAAILALWVYDSRGRRRRAALRTESS